MSIGGTAIVKVKGGNRARLAIIPTAPRRWRVYYTCRAMNPYLAAVDQGTISTQIAVKSVRTLGGFTTHSDVGKRGTELVLIGLDGCAAQDYIERGARRGVKNEPTWWIEVVGRLEIKDGHALIHGDNLEREIAESSAHCDVRSFGWGHFPRGRQWFERPRGKRRIDHDHRFWYDRAVRYLKQLEKLDGKKRIISHRKRPWIRLAADEEKPPLAERSKR